MKEERKINAMHVMFGSCDGHTCGECSNLITGKYHEKTLRKCRLYGVSHSEATDWAKRWPACGKFNCDDRNVCVIRRVIARRPPEALIDGQMKMLDGF